MPEARVLRQLVEALLFERIANWSFEHHPPHRTAKEIVWRLGNSSYSASGQVGAFGRVRIAAGSVRKLVQHGPRPTHWLEILEDVPCAPEVKAAVAEELANTVRLCRWNREHLPALRESRRDLTYEQLEAALHEGHPYHPCFKARTGFSIDDHVSYGPEAGNTFALRWLAVRRPALQSALPGNESALLATMLTGHEECELSHARRRAGASLADYGVLPVHPWQWRQLGNQPAIEAALARRELIELPLTTGRYRASQSLRTLLCVDSPLAPQIKLPLAVRITSSLRTLQPETVRAAPAISRWLERLVGSDPFFERVAGLIVLPEHASALYAPPACDAAVAGHLAVIWREPIGRYLGAGESALPFNALSCSEHDGRPFIDGWVERHGLVPWLDQLLRVVLLPLWRLLAHHGVALEAHAQNLILVHEDGLPKRIAVRDFHDSLEYVPRFLAKPELAPDLAAVDERFRGAPPGRYYAMSSVAELRQLFIDTLFVFNLCELSWLLEQHYGLAEPEFWRRTRAVLAEYDRSIWQQRERARQLRLRAPLVHTESLFKIRLCASADACFSHVVPNALHEVAEREMHARHQ